MAMGLLGQQAKRRAVARAHSTEVALVECHYDVGPETFGKHNNRCVRRAQRKVGVSLHKIGDPRPVARSGEVDVKHTNAAQERGFRPRPQSLGDQVSYLTDDERGDNEVEV
jgi:hypothetical protein